MGVYKSVLKLSDRKFLFLSPPLFFLSSTKLLKSCLHRHRSNCASRKAQSKERSPSSMSRSLRRPVSPRSPPRWWTRRCSPSSVRGATQSEIPFGFPPAPAWECGSLTGPIWSGFHRSIVVPRLLWGLGRSSSKDPCWRAPLPNAFPAMPSLTQSRGWFLAPPSLADALNLASPTSIWSTAKAKKWITTRKKRKKKKMTRERPLRLLKTKDCWMGGKWINWNWP